MPAPLFHRYCIITAIILAIVPAAAGDAAVKDKAPSAQKAPVQASSQDIRISQKIPGGGFIAPYTGKIPKILPYNPWDHCAAGPASSANMPRWSEIKAQNRGYPLGNNGANSTVIGVPDLDNPTKNFGIDDSIQDLLSAIINITHVVKNGNQELNGFSGDGLGVGFCKTQPQPAGKLQLKVHTNKKYCDYVTACGADLPYLWIPFGVDLFQKMDAKLGNTVLGNVLSSKNLQQLTDEQVITVDQEVADKWSLKLVKLYDKLNNIQNDSGFKSAINALQIIQTKAKKYQKWVKDFDNKVNQYAEGYELGAFDDLRPELHYCVGYFGHNTTSVFANLFGGDVKLGSTYSSWNVSEDLRSQVRAGGLSLTAFNKTISLLPSLEINFQTSGLEPWNCDKPFGINANICGTASFTINNNTCSAAAYLSHSNISTPNDFQIQAMKDFYEVTLANGNDPVWPRKVPLNLLPSGVQQMSFPEDLPSHAVMSAGTNFGLDFGLKDPTPRVLTTFPVGPVQAILKWDINYGFRWIHDSNLLMDAAKNAFKNSGSTIDVSKIFERNMHAMQPDDLTADDANSLYVDPALILGLGYAYWNPRKTFGLEISVNLGFLVDLSPTFYGGVADANIALRDALVAANNVDSSQCKAVTSKKKETVASVCSADNFIYDNKPLQNGEDMIDQITKQGKITQQTHQNQYGAVYYTCEKGGKAKLEAQYPVLKDANLKILSCAERGRCIKNISSVAVENVTKAECEAYPGTFDSYKCSDIQKTTIEGWKGPGCNPLLTGGSFPAAPGGACSYAQEGAETETCSDAGFSCVEGACLKKCTGPSDCGGDGSLTCDQTKGVCVRADGLSFVEQIVHRMAANSPDKPIHSVWTHAASKLEAKADFSLGATFKLFLKLLGRTHKIIDKDFSKYWNLLSTGAMRYDVGLSADYNSSCTSGVGDVTNNQPAFVTRTAQLNPPIPPHQYHSDEFAKMCVDVMSKDITDDSGLPKQPTPDNVAGDAANLFNFSQSFALDMWNKYQGKACINGKPWKDWFASLNDTTAFSELSVTLNGVALPSATADRAVLLASGCLNGNVNSPVRNASAIAAVTGKDSNGNIKIYDWLIDQNGDVVPTNIKTAVRLNFKFPGWYNSLQMCVGNFMAQAKFDLADVQLGACHAQTSEGCTLDPGLLQAQNTFARNSTQAQTFKPVVTGLLKKVIHGLDLVTSGHVNSFGLLITKTVGGIPAWKPGQNTNPSINPNVLYYAPGLTNGASGGVVDGVHLIPPSSQPSLSAGTTYALILVPGDNKLMYWRGNSGASSYPNGSAYEFDTASQNWVVPTLGPRDFGFRIEGECQ